MLFRSGLDILRAPSNDGAERTLLRLLDFSVIPSHLMAYELRAFDATWALRGEIVLQRNATALQPLTGLHPAAALMLPPMTDHACRFLNIMPSSGAPAPACHVLMTSAPFWPECSKAGGAHGRCFLPESGQLLRDLEAGFHIRQFPGVDLARLSPDGRLLVALLVQDFPTAGDSLKAAH